MVEALQRGASNEALVCVAAYVLGEYGRLLSDVPVQAQFLLLHERFAALSPDAKVCLLLSALSLRASPELQHMQKTPARRPGILGTPRRCARAHSVLHVQGMLLTAYMKLLVAEPQNTQLKSGVEEVYERYSRCACLLQLP